MPRLLHFFKIGHVEAQVGPISSAGARRRVKAQWDWIETKVKKIASARGKVHRVFNDSLSECEYAWHLAELEKSIRKGMTPNIPDYRIWMHLVTNGATLEITEDLDLLIEFSDLMHNQQILAMDEKSFNRKYCDLIDRRDLFIAGMINRKLQDGETGMLFLGHNHGRNLRLDPGIVMKVHNKYLKAVKRM